MTLREAMRRGAQADMEFRQRRRAMPTGAVPAGRVGEGGREGGRGTTDEDDFIFPRFDPAAAAADAAVVTPARGEGREREGVRDGVSGGGSESPAMRLPHLSRDVKCDGCGWEGVRYRCSRCRVARYCSTKCQRKHWAAEHKDVCDVLVCVRASERVSE